MNEMSSALKTLTPKTVKFTESKRKKKTISDESLKFKIKNIKLSDILWRLAEENFTLMLQKMLKVMTLNIIIEDLLMFKNVVYKLMFKLTKSDIIDQISH